MQRCLSDYVLHMCWPFKVIVFFSLAHLNSWFHPCIPDQKIHMGHFFCLVSSRAVYSALYWAQTCSRSKNIPNPSLNMVTSRHRCLVPRNFLQRPAQMHSITWEQRVQGDSYKLLTLVRFSKSDSMNMYCECMLQYNCARALGKKLDSTQNP